MSCSGSAAVRFWESLCSVFRFQFKKNLRRIISQLYIRDNCHPFKASLLVWVQLPLWISLSLALRNLSLNQSGEFKSAGSGCLVPEWTLIVDRCCVQPCRRSWQQGALCGSLTSRYRTPPGSCPFVWVSPTCSLWK